MPTTSTSSSRSATAAPDPTSNVIACYNPATREFLGEIPVDSPEDVVEAVRRARVAQKEWKKSSFDTRRRVLRHIWDEVLDRADELCEIVVTDSGKTLENSMAGEIWPVCEKLRWTIKHGEKYLKPERLPSDMLRHKTATIEYHPLGVVAAIIPWNYPLQNVMNQAIPALFSGNGYVAKPSEWVAWSSAQFKGIFDRALEREGFSPDLVQIVQGYGPTGKALVESGVNGVCFIGSVTNGRRVIEASAKNVIPVIMELGGKDAMIVCDDADLEQAVHSAINGTFINCGQNCISSERILIHEGIYDAFEAGVKEITDQMVQGAPLGGGPVDVGAMITPIQISLVEKLVESAKAEGARVVCGGGRVMTDKGDFFAPTILADCTPEMTIMNEEVFGPVMLLMKVRDDEHAIEVSNGTSFGLSGSVFSKDHARAKRITDELETGSVTINDFGLIYMAQELPFGGVGLSGFGNMNGREGLRACCNQKGIVGDRFKLHTANKMYPVDAASYDMVKSAVHLVYGRNVKERVGAMKSLFGQFFGKKDGG